MSDLAMHLSEFGSERASVASGFKCMTRLTATTNVVCWIVIKILSFFLDESIAFYILKAVCIH